MKLSSKQISENYRLCYDFTYSLLQKDFNLRGQKIHSENTELVDLIQSVIGHEDIVNLIQTVPFGFQNYKQTILDILPQVKKSLFPDVRKKRYISLNDEKFKFIEESLVSDTSEKNNHVQNKDVYPIDNLLTPDLAEYFKNQLVANNPNIAESVIRLPKSTKDLGAFKKNLNQKVYLFKKFYPDGKIEINQNIDVSKSISKKQLINTYLNVYLEIDKFFPKVFFKRIQINAPQYW